MKIQSLIAAFLCCALASASFAAETFKDVNYLHKTDGKDKTEMIEGKLTVDATALKFDGKKAPLDIADSTITKIVYERSSKPHYAAAIFVSPLFLFSKSKQHFLTVEYGSSYALFRLDKGNYREILAAVESSTGKKIERSEEK